MNALGNIESKFVKWGNKAEQPGKKWANNKSGEKIPAKKFDDARSAGAAFFPSDF